MLTRRCESAEEDSESHIERGLYGSFNDLVRGKNFLNEMIFYFTFTYENTFLKAFLTVFVSFIRKKSQFLCGASLRGVN